MIERFARMQLGLPVERKDLGLEDWGLKTRFEHTWPQFVRYYQSDGLALPDAGAYSEQDAATMDDFGKLGALVAFHIQKLRPLVGGADDTADDAAPPVDTGYE